jgi:hypothetical protein
MNRTGFIVGLGFDLDLDLDLADTALDHIDCISYSHGARCMLTAVYVYTVVYIYTVVHDTMQ